MDYFMMEYKSCFEMTDFLNAVYNFNKDVKNWTKDGWTVHTVCVGTEEDKPFEIIYVLYQRN